MLTRSPLSYFFSVKDIDKILLARIQTLASTVSMATLFHIKKYTFLCVASVNDNITFRYFTTDTALFQMLTNVRAILVLMEELVRTAKINSHASVHLALQVPSVKKLVSKEEKVVSDYWHYLH